MKRTLELLLPVPDNIIGGNSRGYSRWKSKAFRQAKVHAEGIIRATFINARRWPLVKPFFVGPVTMDVEWSTPNPAHFPDVDNLVARLKPYLDAGEAQNVYTNDKQVELGTVTRVKGKRQVTLTFTGEGE